MKTILLRSCLLVLVLLVAGAVRAETLRIAVVVGSNRGDVSRAPLRFAEQDAARFAAVLTELGGLAPSDVMLLQQPTLVDVRAALDEAARRVSSWHGRSRGQAVLLFYFSGHSDGTVLELGRHALPFAEVRQRLAGAGADVRLVILDSCRSGALLALKGGTLGQSFDIRIADELASTGEAMISSSAANESALESSEIQGSFFSHYFISGLRGAADLSGDGMVTLAEAYQYAFVRTLRSTSDTTVGPQHPAYDYRLTGQGDLVLTRLQTPSSVLEIPPGFERLLLVSTPGEQVLAELGAGSGRRIAVPAGTYKLRAWKGGQTFGARVTVTAGQALRVAADELQPVHTGAVANKGDAEAVVAASAAPVIGPQEPRAWSLSLGGGVMDGAAKRTWLGGLQLGVERRFGAKQVDVALRAGTGRASGMRENRITAEAIPSLWTGAGRLGAGLGLGLGGGIASEQLDVGKTHWSGLGFVSPTLLLALRLGHGFDVFANASLPLTLLRRDDHMTFTTLGNVWIGLLRAL